MIFFSFTFGKLTGRAALGNWCFLAPFVLCALCSLAPLSASVASFGQVFEKVQWNIPQQANLYKYSIYVYIIYIYIIFININIHDIYIYIHTYIYVSVCVCMYVSGYLCA